MPINTEEDFGLKGKAIINADIRVITGLRIGGTSGGLKIGGVDQNVIIDPLGKPYIPGSSLKGKLRSLLEQKFAVNNKNYFDRNGQRKITSLEDYRNDPASQIFGIILQNRNIADEFLGIPTPTRLIVRDSYLDESSITSKMHENMDLAYTEVKYETAIDRIQGNAARGSLRQIERVPAGAVFSNLEMVFNVYYPSDKELFKHLFTAMKLLEDDYLGGMGSRGYGKVTFEGLKIYWNSIKDYESGNLPGTQINSGHDTVEKLMQNIDSVTVQLK